MANVQEPKIQWEIYLFLVILYCYSSPAQAQYGGGTGERNDPYLIYTAEQMNAIGANQGDWDKHFKLMTNIDMSGFDGNNGRPSFNIIGTGWNTQFTGVFDGDGHTISHLTIKGKYFLGLFGRLGSGAEVRNLGVVEVNINVSSNYVGGLVGNNQGNVTQCYTSGMVTGGVNVGGLVGNNQGDVSGCYSTSAVSGGLYIGGLVGGNGGSVTSCYSVGAVDGTGSNVGGLVGNNWGDVTGCYSTSVVSGDSWLGGLIGYNWSDVTDCYSTGAVSGNSWLGGLLGSNRGDVTHCYSTGTVSGSIFVGGLVGYNFNRVTDCFWDMETSGQSSSNAGTGKTTTEMQISVTFNGWGGWNNQSNSMWTIDEGNDYPRLWWENAPGHVIEPTRKYLIFATNPNPIDGAIHDDTLVSLSWKPGSRAASHDVYFGDNLEDVNSGTEDTFQGNQTETAFIVGFTGFPYPDGLVPGTTYYWRIDEVNDNEPNSPWKGPVWSFSIPLRIAYNPDPANGVESVELDAKLSWTPGFGAKLHNVYFGDKFDNVNNATGAFPQGAATYHPGQLELAKTYYWRVDEFDGVVTHKGDVWSFITQGAVGNPNPSNGAVDAKQIPILTWTHGVYADSHQVYFGTDKDAVKNADTGSPEYKGSDNLGSESYDPGKLSMDITYYWRIDEVNNANPDSPWTGPVWSFTTADSIVVDDFESYNDLNPDDPKSNRIFLTWIDGWDNPARNGSIVSSFDMDFPWREIDAHSGVQAMWFFYDNSVGKSEATMTLRYPRDWTEEGVGVLSLWFYGNPDNAPEPMYVALNDSAVVYHDNSIEALIDTWIEWTIGLQEFADQGVNLTNVNSITLGFGNKNNPVAGGSGEMWFDDIRLYRPVPQETAL